MRLFLKRGEKKSKPMIIPLKMVRRVLLQHVAIL